jgi:hypothetical protein
VNVNRIISYYINANEAAQFVLSQKEETSDFQALAQSQREPGQEVGMNRPPATEAPR